MIYINNHYSRNTSVKCYLKERKTKSKQQTNINCIHTKVIIIKNDDAGRNCNHK